MSRDRLLKQMVRDRFVITLLNGQTFDGLLDRFDATHLELVDSHQITAEGKHPIDGRFYLPRVQVAFMQRPEAV